jgi:mono/diheme cytochrome c family protein
MGRWKTCVVLFFVGVGLSVGYLQRPTRAAAPPQKKGGRAAQLERGRALYMQNCARCHGADGRSQTEQGELYGATDLADGRWWKDARVNDRRLTSAIANGKRGGMPAFGKRLAKGDIAALVVFVRTLKQ